MTLTELTEALREINLRNGSEGLADEAIARAVAEDRARIVAWLRAHADADAHGIDGFLVAADAIEAGRIPKF